MISLIYPTREKTGTGLFIDSDDCKALFGNFLYDRELDISEFMTDDSETIKRRQEIFYDMLNEPKIASLIKDILPMLENINELYKLRDISHETEGQIYSIKLIELYIAFINTLFEKTSEFRQNITSQALLELSETISNIVNDEEFKSLVKNTNKLSKEITEVKSITVGLNLDHTFTPCEFAVLSLNSEHIISSNFMDRLTHKNDDSKLTALCPLKVTAKSLSKEEKTFADMAIGSVINRLLKSSIRDWEPAIKLFFRQRTKMFLPLIKELKYLLFGVRILEELKEKRLPLAMPVIKPKCEKSFIVKDMYNPIIALHKDGMVYNDIEFDADGRIYVITGPNSGGKSVFTSAVGICQIFAQLGFLVPARYAEISPVDRIFVSFANKSGSKSKGRLEEECVRMKAVFDSLTEHSLVLMDETFSSTSSFEGAHIAFDVLSVFSAFGCKAVFSTHLHELVSMISEINGSDDCLSKIDTLSVGIDSDGSRTYKIVRAIPDGRSYARSISCRYGLNLDAVRNRRSF